ncbi:hypothetical protein L8P11_22130, partial [Enterobacter kobei]|nr:hypothetical protein [Enterobacter kobei]
VLDTLKGKLGLAERHLSDVTSSKPTLHLSVYDRNRDGEGFLGMLDIKPVLQDGYVLDNWYKLDTRGDETVTGEVWIQMTYTIIRVSRSFLFTL